MPDLLDENLIPFLRGLALNPYMGIVIVNREGTVLVANDTYLETVGKTREEAIGKHVLEVTPNSLLPEVLETGRVYLADHWPVNGHDTIVARFPIWKDGEIIGAVGKSLFLDLSGAKVLARRMQELERELDAYRQEVRDLHRARWQLHDIIGDSPAMTEVRKLAEQMARTTSTVLVTGESGCGKELVAHAIHCVSDRWEQPFIRVNCASLPEHLLESELFGYEDGAFTGARKGGKPGKFELADGGTIFLDEIGDMPLAMQTKLLSVLQEKEIERVGGTRTIYVNVRVIAATNQDLEEMVRQKLFRGDLYYRLNVVRLSIPPLRERREDIPLLVKTLLGRINDRLRTDITEITPEALDLLSTHDWPGNVRELENLLERAVNLADMNHEHRIMRKHFPSLVRPLQAAAQGDGSDGGESLTDSLERIERQMILQALEQTGGNRVQTARLLGIHSSALYRKLEKYGLMRR
ncbi:MAG: sigma 54-interacting transcriptional regulator [Syntrophomonadaceae bacterium]|nr:sigma 54-interacting transcriptional regulator [Syntrophomonadaceae bacterium]MDH7497398.1 sigma 54-interacting transcriptional regulator [Syntrophomonadaceae bacterium]